MKNEGKRFEEDFKKSIPTDMFYYRLRDGTSSWGDQANTRFQATNICDYIVFANETLYLLELKSTKGTSIPYTSLRDNQIDGLFDALSKKGDIRAWFVINFREKEETYMLSVVNVKAFMIESTRKSIDYQFIKDNGKLIPQTKKRTRITYDFSNIF